MVGVCGCIMVCISRSFAQQIRKNHTGSVMGFATRDAWLDAMLEEAASAKAEGNQLFGAGKLHAAIIA